MKRFIKNYYFLPVITVLVLVSVIAVRCKKPTDGIVISVNTSGLFHYTALVQVVDPSGAVPNNLSVALSGANAASIYGIDGKKALGAPAGIISLAVHPKLEPTAASPLKFTLTVTGPGYLPLTIPVTIKSTDSTQIIKAYIVNLTVATAGVANAATTGAAVAGTVATPIVVSTPTSPGNPESTTVTIPATTKLQDASGNTISASSVAVTVNNFNTAQQTAVNLFPGSSLAAAGVDVGGTPTNLVLLPAGFVNIDMTAAGQAVKKFSSPINIQMTLNPAYKLASTGAAITAGSVLGIYSYDTGTGLWKFEQNATVTLVGGNPVVNFTANHLTEFFAGDALASLGALNVNIGATWFDPKFDYNITLVATMPNATSGYEIYRQVFQLDASLLTKLDGKIPVPTASQPVTLSFFSNTGTLLGTATLTATTGSITVTLTQPPSNPPVTLTLKLACSSTTTTSVATVVTPPDFYLFYKPTGQPVANYQLLGTVEAGSITTGQLAATTAYDFKAVLNKNVKEVINHTVAENTTANQTVGGAFNNGTKVPAQNQLDVASLCSTLP